MGTGRRRPLAGGAGKHNRRRGRAAAPGLPPPGTCGLGGTGAGQGVQPVRWGAAGQNPGAAGDGGGTRDPVTLTARVLRHLHLHWARLWRTPGKGLVASVWVLIGRGCEQGGGVGEAEIKGSGPSPRKAGEATFKII